ncbi:sensor histidine kinase KdpD [Mucilaginibacter sp.]|uniref:sensor histidine kinase n=1 Tax=Mucilaginibacter sp. TaxID=1882438 RepID=UPI00262BDECA|nr:HAMP domain-containing sensor histidine kinase [Mucilaginibacter sp.]MDB4925169.1 walK 1 [Mucilaginibacter sp.]
MHLKNKLRAGIGFLFLMALISSGLAAYYLNRLAVDSKVVLKDNYRSLTYTKNIGQVLNDSKKERLDSQTIKTIETNLKKEEQNITEPGEAKLADSLRINFELYQFAPYNALYKSNMMAAVYAIMQLNMDAIQHKYDKAIKTADDAILIVSLMGSVCFLIAFSFMVNFPGYIANPLKKNLDALKQISDNKTTFIATISHELKTPISSIKMGLKLLQDERVGPVNNEQQELLKDIENDTQRMLQITGELINVAQAETGNIQLNFGSTHPKNIVSYAVRVIKSLAEQKEIVIDTLCPDSLPNVVADLDKATWVLTNLLSNAVKYSPAKSTIILQVKRQNNNAIEFSVKDDGYGIDSIYLSRIFERYFKVPGADPDQTGTGLGLAIAKDFIEAQGGMIGVESDPGNGSRFHFTLTTNKA